MIYRFWAVFLLCASSGMAQELREAPQFNYRVGEAARYGSRDATAMSMMGWGLGLGAGICALCALIPSSSYTHSHSH